MPPDRELFESQVPAAERESTTFCQDFLVAERFGLTAIKGTFNRAFNGWKSNYKYLTELAMVLNHLMAIHYVKDGEVDPRTRLYRSLWESAFGWGRTHLKGAELQYFYAVLD